MTRFSNNREFKVFTTCPVTSMAEPRHCLRRLQAVSQWSEEAGCEGILVFSDNRQIDPWLVSQVIIKATERLCPLVAVQPAYMHPYSVAKMITSLAFLHGRRVYLNMVAGGFKNDLIALNDGTPHDERYARLIEYTAIIQRLLQTPEAVSFTGDYYQVTNLKLTPSLPEELQPGLLVSGSSEAGRNAARVLKATAIEYPKPAAEYASSRANGGSSGIRIGLIARDDEAEAWAIAHARYPGDRKGQLTRKLATKVSDSSWHHQLASMGESEASTNTTYWLVPFQNYKAMCPYLVGSYAQVSQELARYVQCGYTTFILDEPPDAQEMRHIGVAFERAFERALAA
jgi:alkanesulfonate monooxygenase